MMCEGAGKPGARTGSVSATFTLSGQGNATLRASSHFSMMLGQFGSSGGKEMEKREQRGGVKVRRCGLNQPAVSLELHSVHCSYQMPM